MTITTLPCAWHGNRAARLSALARRAAFRARCLSVRGLVGAAFVLRLRAFRLSRLATV